MWIRVAYVVFVAVNCCDKKRHESIYYSSSKIFYKITTRLNVFHASIAEGIIFLWNKECDAISNSVLFWVLSCACAKHGLCMAPQDLKQIPACKTQWLGVKFGLSTQKKKNQRSKLL